MDSLPVMRAAAASRTGNSHERNEDAYRMLDGGNAAVRQRRRGVLYAVADGVSTSELGAYASRAVCERLDRFFDETVHPEIGWLAQQVLDVDKQLRAEGKGKAATTLSALWLVESWAWHVHVGNSEILRLRQGAVSWITPAPGQGSRRQLRNFVGMGGVDRELSVERVRAEPGDLFLLFTDGVREAFPNADELSQLWGKAREDPQRLVSSVMGRVDELNIDDDATMVAAYVLGLQSMKVSVIRPR